MLLDAVTMDGSFYASLTSFSANVLSVEQRGKRRRDALLEHLDLPVPDPAAVDGVELGEPGQKSQAKMPRTVTRL
jgi:hypothetical protein